MAQRVRSHQTFNPEPHLGKSACNPFAPVAGSLTEPAVRLLLLTLHTSSVILALTLVATGYR